MNFKRDGVSRNLNQNLCLSDSVPGNNHHTTPPFLTYPCKSVLSTFAHNWTFKFEFFLWHPFESIFFFHQEMQMGTNLVFIWGFSAVFIATTLFATSSFALTQDGLALLEFKQTLNDTKNVLSNWVDNDETPCLWTGITCHPSDQRVLSINLPYMEFGGFISPSIGKLSRLQRLALHQNSLHGLIPNEISKCVELRALNLSTNFFSGEIPNFGALSNFGNNSYIGNLDLCGQQIHKPCKTSLGFPAVLPHAEMPKHSSRYLKGALIGATTTLGLMLVLLLIWMLTKKERAAKRYVVVKKQVHQETSTQLITFHGDLPYPSSEIIEKLESLDVEHVVGVGGFGTVYRMVMNDCGTFAVKRIERSREGRDQAFERELEILGSVKHINLVNLRGYCRFPDSKLLIYDYVAMGKCPQGNQTLSWNARLKVAYGSARGLAYLHHDCSPKIVHRDIKSSNILLNENLEPCVSDFGLAKLLVDEEAHVTTVVAGTFGYLAPEYLQSGRATVKSDVYSFGVLLLELVTGKRPTDPAFVKRGLNVVGWLNTLRKENQLEDVVDERCTDADASTVEAVLEIAGRCTDANPEDRPSMQQVLQFLEQEVMSPCPSDFYDSHSDYA
ncbi:Leucine-rich repeat-containing N-terminal, type 2 [Cynara cardunculus var. scolymus]|uniref:Leucine-rich repeat-containing N-terminal, type 2 n=1 Tax=Cynara cardunculus var. scolymus TaxID=59895 RepID=A0A118K3R3_CYNCS|nr:Leucine-rich repeat-containing N-terminal, type 2 [Cynara cardunculus var. scolymus]